ncbi:MAG: hypothetical protein BJ554DRAFT_394, partial [Olpidium bornovanus]
SPGLLRGGGPVRLHRGRQDSLARVEGEARPAKRTFAEPSSTTVLSDGAGPAVDPAGGADVSGSAARQSEAFVGSMLTRLASCESMYTSLAFLKPSIFRKEDFLTNAYASILEDIKKETATRWSSSGSASPPSRDDCGSISDLRGSVDGDAFFVVDFAVRLHGLIKVRRALIAVYKCLASLDGQQQQQQTSSASAGAMVPAGPTDADDLGVAVDRYTLLQGVLDEVRGIRTLATSDSNLCNPF